jgi:creatinine amidohydrolase
MLISQKWGRLEQLRPDQIEQIVSTSPVAYWPLGLMEHHGWALPVGFDGVKADRYCDRLAATTGGVVLPVMWWGADGGHGDFKWTFYQDREAGKRIVETTVLKLIDNGLRVIIVYAGHYPWQGMLDEVLPAIRDANPDVLLLWGFECTIAGDAVNAPGDHAARWETAYGLALLPDLIDTAALKPGRDPESSWPNTGIPPQENWHPRVEFDATKPLFAQMGEDPKLSSAEEAEEYLDQLTNFLTNTVNTHLKRG